MSNKNTGYTASGNALVQQHQTAAQPREEVDRHQQFLKARLDQLARWVTGGVKAEALVRFALLDLSQNAKLRACDPQSIFLGLLACAQCGLEPGALRGESYLVPFGGKAQFLAGYKGLIKMARRSREVQTIGSEVVRERDKFELALGSEPRILHVPQIGDRGAVIGAYAVAKLQGGGRELEWMDVEELDKIRHIAEARGKSPAWSGWESEMQRKSAIRRLCKRLPLGQDYFVAQALDDSHENGQSQAEILDVLTEGEVTRVEQQAAKAPPGPQIASGPISDDEAALIRAQEAKES